MSITELKEKYISAQWGSFVEHAVVNIDLAREIYKKNKDSERSKNRRKAIAGRENVLASISIILLASALESIANAHAFWQKKKNFNQWDPLVKRLCLVTKLDNDIKQAIQEFSIARDGIIHGYIWIKSRRYKPDYSIRFVKAYLWKPLKVNLGKKFKNFVDWDNRVTKQFKFSIIPTDVNFLDSLMGLLLMKKILDLLGYQNKYPQIYNLKNMGFSNETAKIPLSNNFCTIEDWANYFQGFLDTKYDKTIFDYLLNNL